MRTCCLNCDKRTITCHSSCKKYKDLQTECERIREQKRKDGEFLAIATRKMPRKRKRYDR